MTRRNATNTWLWMYRLVLESRNSRWLPKGYPIAILEGPDVVQVPVEEVQTGAIAVHRWHEDEPEARLKIQGVQKKPWNRAIIRWKDVQKAYAFTHDQDD